MGTRKRKPANQKQGSAARRRRADTDPFLPDPVLQPGAPSAPLLLRLLLPAVVACAAFINYWPALDAGFLNWDDDKVVTENIHFRGLNASNLEWMFTEHKMGHYHPLTWFTYSVDHAVSRAREEALRDQAGTATPEGRAAADALERYERGLDPRIFHLTNMLLHAAVAVAFYFLARLLLRLVLPAPPDRPDLAAPFAAALAALLFACHPLRVETVAWVTERRDVVSTVFLLPCLLCYIKYVLVPGWGGRKLAYYAASVVLLVVSLLGKAWGITLPAIMLILDIYPLRRIGGKAGWLTPRAIYAYVDKAPFGFAALIFAMKAKDAQASALDTMKTLEEWGYADRVAQAFYGLFFYAYKTIVPINLTPLVPLPVENDPFALRYVVAATVVLAAAILLIVFRKRWPAGVVLAACYTIILSPVLGFAQSGPQLVADKYSYIACMTWAILGGGGLLWLLRNRSRLSWARKATPPAAAAAILVCAVFAVLTWRQTKVWQSSRSLWTHAIEVDGRTVLARTNLGMIERQAGNVDEAIAHYEAGLEVDPRNYALLNNLAVAYREHPEHKGDPEWLEKSIAITRRALEIQPKHPDLHYALGTALEQAGRGEEAAKHFRTAIGFKPDVPKYRRALGEHYLKTNNLDAAEEQFQTALRLEQRLDPAGMGVINALDRLARINMARGDWDKGIAYFERILRIDPNNVPAQRGIARARARQP